ncbi:hypothetical protein KI688_009137 [Linnemannia hyalina]|uniref:Crinkler effector protein N-terminal domain-containing protein n=1 Tax=Linnemannia hyalina TaxID=64524 RepID=A0A9P7XZ63_9FUNG|nr:hypothetical protein KI688_009137 [Linnemannia hyalina]
MTDNSLSLSLRCLIDGDRTSRSFDLITPSTETLVNSEAPSISASLFGLRILEAEDLTLWKVTIPITKDNADTPILLENVSSSDKDKLGPKDDVSEWFPQVPRKKTIHIIVQRPPQDKPAHLISVPEERFEQELAIILNGVHHQYTNHSLDLKELEMSHKEQRMLGLALGKQARTTTGETQRSIVEDPNFLTLARDVENIYMSVVDEEQGDQLGIVFKVKARAGERVELEILARLLFLKFLLASKPALDQFQFFREQTTTGDATIGKLVHILQEYDIHTIRAMLRKTQTKLHLLLVPRRLGLVIAMDEAKIVENGILPNRLISPSALIDNKYNTYAIFNVKNQVHLKHLRGFLEPLSPTLSSIQATLVILGTALSLQNVVNLYSGVDKPTNLTRITEFPQLDENEVNNMLSDLVDLSDCEIPPAKRRKLSGRAQFSLGIIRRLIVPNATQISKQAILDIAVDDTIEHLKHVLRENVRTILRSDKTGEVSRFLCRMLLANRLRGGKITFSTNQQFDFVNMVLCSLRQHPDGVHQIMNEPMVLEAEEVLKSLGKDCAFSEYLDQLYQIITNFGVGSTSKGDVLEPLFRRSLQRSNDFRLVDLPFLKGIA